MKLIVTGPRGKMGRLITQVAAEHPDIHLVAGVGPAGRDYIGKDLGEVAMTGRRLGVPVVDDLEAVIDDCDVLIDFSTKETGLQVLESAVRHKKALVCGTTGFSSEEMAKFREAASSIPMLYAANTSKLVNIMNKLLELVATAVGGRGGHRDTGDARPVEEGCPQRHLQGDGGDHGPRHRKGAG